MPLPDSISAVRAAIAGKRSELAAHAEAVCAAAAEWARVGQWTLEDWVNEAQAIGMRREDVERVFYDVAAVGFIDFGGRQITNPRYYLAKRKANQPSYGKEMPRAGQANSPEWVRAYEDISDMIWRARESGDPEAVRRAMQHARDQYKDVPLANGRDVVRCAIERAMNNPRKEGK